ncbi:MAG TPA: hypothetical protein VFO63_20360, partial [Blastocatellia bacterium]|nr:hypothetical protein [Blastocatellia bacterium]
MFNGSYFCYRTISVSLSLLLGLILTTTAYAQTSAFTYQGRLTDSANPADGIFDMQFKLFDTATVGTGIQQGATITKGTVQVTNGVFDVELDFGAGVFTGAGRFLEISLRPAGSPDPRTILSPRQPVTSAPYAVRSATAGAADTATNATNASQLGGIAASGFIQNSASQQASTHFNISGNGTVGGLLSANAVNATAQYNLNGSRVLIAGGTGNLFVGLNAGAANTTGANNSFFGRDAGQANQTGSANAFFGAAAGIFNTASNNAFFGALAGDSNTSGTGNSFFGTSAGGGNQTGTNNSFFGFGAGFVNNANDNSFFGTFAGDSNTSGTNNSFFGRSAGQANQTGSGNSFF